MFKLVATVVSYSSGSAGGIFGPSLYVGGMISGAVGLLTRYALGNPSIHPGAFALVGMGAFFAGVVRAPVTSIIIIFEMTHNYAIILPLMIANIISYALATELKPTPIYDSLLLQDGVHLTHSETQVLKRLTVGAVRTRNVMTVKSSLTAAQAFEYVQTLPQLHRAYPMLDPAGQLAGLITYNDLKRALAAGQGARRIDELSGKKLVQAHSDDTLQVAVFKLGRRGFMRMPVVSRQNPTQLLGIITMHDIAAALAEEDDDTDLLRTTGELRLGAKDCA